MANISFEEKLEEAQERRENNEWALGPNCPKEGVLAHVLLKHLIREGIVDQEKDNIDVYSMYPLNYDYYDLTQFNVLKEDIEDEVYAVGNERDTKDSAVQYLEEIIVNAGVPKETMRYYLDEGKIVDYAEEVYRDWIYQEPESYLSDEDKETSRQQDEEMDILTSKKEEIESQIDNLQEYLEGEHSERVKSKIEHLENIIENIVDEIQEILDNPDGDYKQEAFEREIDIQVDNARSNPESFVYDMGLNPQEFFDKDAYIEDVIRSDGYGLLSSYDGSENEVYLENKEYYVFRIE